MWHFVAAVACLVCRIGRENGSVPFLSSHCLNEVSVWNRQLLLSQPVAPPKIAYPFISICLCCMSAFYYGRESVSGRVCVCLLCWCWSESGGGFVVSGALLTSVGIWGAYVKSLAQRAFVHTLQPARQLLARIVGRDFRERFATQPSCFHVRKIFNVPHFRQCIKAVSGRASRPLVTNVSRRSLRMSVTQKSANLPSLCHGRLDLIMCTPPGHFRFTRALVLWALSPKQHIKGFVILISTSC